MPKRTAAAPTITEEIIERVIVLLVTVRSRADVLKTCTEHAQLALTPNQAAAAVDEAHRRINLAAVRDFDHELGTQKTRLADLYQKAAKVHDYKAALAVLKERNRLLDLYPNRKGPTEDDPADDAAIAEIAAARAHLAPLVHADDDEPLEEIARRVVGLFVKKGSRKSSRT